MSVFNYVCHLRNNDNIGSHTEVEDSLPTVAPKNLPVRDHVVPSAHSFSHCGQATYCELRGLKEFRWLFMYLKAELSKILTRIRVETAKTLRFQIEERVKNVWDFICTKQFSKSPKIFEKDELILDRNGFSAVKICQ